MGTQEKNDYCSLKTPDTQKPGLSLKLEYKKTLNSGETQ